MTNLEQIHARKTRALKKYEADPERYAPGTCNPDVKIFSPFGPMIGKMRVPQVLIDRLNSYADRIAQPDKGSEFTLPDEILDDGTDKSLMAVTSALIADFLREVENTEVGKIDYEVFWIVSQYHSTPSPMHFHSGDISGVMFLKLPEINEEEEIKTYISGRQAGYLNFLNNGKQRFSKSLISFKPQVGDYYVFPGWLLHGAEPFRGTGERRSLAFNAYLGGT
jgi:hypothetical protein